MAIFDPPDGSIDPRPRCVGDCCRCFSLEFPLQKVSEEYQKFKVDPASATIPNVDIIHDMLIPLGKVRGQEIFTCKHLGANGDCGIYETRPKMCRDFPGPDPCKYRNCASHGPQPGWKRFLNWLRD